MRYECKIFNQKGKLIKIVSPKAQSEGVDKEFFNKKSTIKAQITIRRFKDPKGSDKPRFRFKDRKCVVCEEIFFSRQKITKYCSSECQKELYKKKQ